MYNNFTFDKGGRSSPKHNVLILLLFIMKWLRMDSFLKLSILNAVMDRACFHVEHQADAIDSLYLLP